MLRRSKPHPQHVEQEACRAEEHAGQGIMLSRGACRADNVSSQNENPRVDIWKALLEWQNFRKGLRSIEQVLLQSL